MDSMLPLDQPRTIVLFRGPQKFTHQFSRIASDTWAECFGRFVIEEEQVTIGDGGDKKAEGIARRVDIESALLWLYGKTILSVQGYLLTDGRPLVEIPEWQERVPREHRRAVANALIDVTRTPDSGGLAIHPQWEEVKLDAAWSAAADGALEKFTGLVHRFAPPTLAHQRTFKRKSSESVVIGGSRTGRTIYRARESVLLGLYDELIREVAGYAVNGAALTGSEEIQRWMDGWHKVAAVGQLFAGGDSELVVGAEAAKE